MRRDKSDRTIVELMRTRGQRARSWLPWSAVPAAALISGCTVVSSESALEIAKRGEPMQGMLYRFPTGLVDVKLSVVNETAKFNLVVNGPRYVAKPEHSHVLRYTPHISYDDKVEVTVNGRGFLQAIALTSTDQTEAVILSVVGALAAFDPLETAPAAAPADTVTPLAERVVDPTQPRAMEELISDLNEKVLEHSSARARTCGKLADKINLRNRTACTEYVALAAAVRRWKENPKANQPPVRFHLERPSIPATGTPADCSIGICYRPALPYRLSYAFGNGQASIAMDLPNESPPVQVDLTRAFLVTKIQSVSFDATTGLLTSIAVKKPSELQAAAKLPLKVVKAVGDALALRVRLVETQTGSINARRDLIEAQRKSRLESAQVTVPAGPVVSNISPALPPPRTAAAPVVPVTGPPTTDLGLPDNPMPPGR